MCRVTANLTPTLAETAPRWARALAPVAERVAQALYDRRYVAVPLPAGLAVSPDTAERHERAARAQRRALPTKLTQESRSRGREGVRRKGRPATREPQPALFPACRGCGVRLTSHDRRYCDACLPEQRAESVATFSAAGPAALAARRAAGDDPAHGGEAGRKKGARNATHHEENARWEREHGGRIDAEQFTNEILPGLRGAPLGVLMKRTGLSLRYCSLIRRGVQVPHPRHWPALTELAAGATRMPVRGAAAS